MDLKSRILEEVKRRKLGRELASAGVDGLPLSSDTKNSVTASEDVNDFTSFQQYRDIQLHRMAAEKLRISNPFFKVHQGLSSDTSLIAGKQLLNFSSYDYLGINGDSRQLERAERALRHYGVSSSASRMVSGEREIQQELEQRLAELHGVEAAAVFVSGHATNVSTLGHLFDQQDLIVHDSLVHNSILEGIKLSGARRVGFSHNDIGELDKLLVGQRGKFRRVLIVVEGLYSMDGDYPDLPRLLEIKQRHGALLMIDEAHSIGVMGKTGKGIAEHFAVNSSDVDIWMGTLSKALASTGGYIAGSEALIEIIKNTVPGFVYSVGLPPVLAAAAVAALDILQQEPERVARLRSNAQLFDSLAKARGIDTGKNRQLSVIPVMVSGSINAAKAAHRLAELDINVQPIIYPAVEERMARLRFFICSSHNESQIRQAVDALASVIADLN